MTMPDSRMLSVFHKHSLRTTGPFSRSQGLSKLSCLPKGYMPGLAWWGLDREWEKFSVNKIENPKSIKRKAVGYLQGDPIRPSADFSGKLYRSERISTKYAM